MPDTKSPTDLIAEIGGPTDVALNFDELCAFLGDENLPVSGTTVRRYIRRQIIPPPFYPRPGKPHWWRNELLALRSDQVRQRRQMVAGMLDAALRRPPAMV